MADRHNYIALDWVTGEIEETLKQARQSLEDYVADREDATKLRFCLTYAHQVHGSLKMVELDGAAMLAAELEALIQDLVHQQVADDKIEHALESLMSGLLQLSAYLQRVQTTQQDQPSTLLTSLNQLRLARGEEELTNAAVFNPVVEQADNQEVSKPRIDPREFNDLVRKLRQIYQTSMVGIVRDQDVKSNFQNMLKVASRIHKVSDATASESLWAVIHAVLQGLEAEAKPASNDVKTVLRQIDGELKVLQEQSRDALELTPKPSLLKSLLYSVAQFTTTTPLIASIQEQYQLKSALEQSQQESNIALPDTEAIRSVVEALNEELDSVQDILDQNTRADTASDYDLSTSLPILQRVINALSVLGAKDALHVLQDQHTVIEGMVNQAEKPDADVLMDIAAHIVTIQEALTRSRSIDEARNLDVSNEQLNQAQLSVIREARNGLEQAKESVVEFVASQWDVDALQDLPNTLEQIHGGLAMVPLDRAAKVIESCKEYVATELIEKRIVPEWQMLDMLADAMTSVEYYLDCLSGETPSELDEVLDVAIKSVSQLGYGFASERNLAESSQNALSGESEDNSSIAEAADIVDANTSSLVGASDVSEPDQDSNLQTDQKDSHLAEIDDEVVEIFIEEAAEVLEDVENALPKWKENLGDSGVLTDLCRSFHTLKGSGRMVGASTMSDLGWSVENMFNRLIEGNRSANQDHVDIVERAVAAMPEIVNAFEQRREIDNTQDVEQLIEEAQALSARSLSQSKPNSPAVSGVEATSDQTDNQDQSVNLQKVEPENTDTDSNSADVLAAGAVVAAGLGVAVGALGNEEPDDSMADVDDDVVEIFIEEVGEVLETISESMPRWQSNHQDNEALTEIRRSYHTLKGSGRMVEAKVISELAWSVENMLNRVLEGSQPASIQHIDVVTQSNKLIPGLVEAYERRVIAHAKPKAEALSQLAERVSKGDIEFDVAHELDALIGSPNDATGTDAIVTPTEEYIEASDISNVPDISDTRDESDSALLEIFDSEAHSHLEVYKGFVNAAENETGKVELTEALQRALHTLKGSAYMAEMSSIAALVTPIERLVKEMRGCHLLADQTVISTLSEGAALLDKGLTQISDNPDQPIDGADEYIERVKHIHHEQLQLIGQDPSETTDAAQKSGALLAEGMEKILGTYDLVTGWTLMQITPEQLDGLIGDLNSLSNVAEQTEYPHVQAMSDALVGVYQKVDLEKPLSDEFFTATEAGHESLIDMMDVIAAGQRPVSAVEQLEKLKIISDQLQEQLDQSDVELKPAPIVLPDIDLSEDIAATQALLPELDTETLDIFNEEAVELVESLDQGLSQWRQEPEEMQYLEELKRHLHTLKGGARLSGIKLLGDISHDYEAFLEQHSVKAEGFFEGAQQYQSRVNAIVDTLSIPLPEQATSEQVQQSDAKQDMDSAADHVSDSQNAETQHYENDVTLGNVDDLDPEMLEILLEEARDQQEGIEQALDQWGDGDESAVDELKRILHTLKGGARLAGVAALGNLAHNFETYLINSEANGEVKTDAFKEQMFEYQSQLASMLDQLSGVDQQAVEPMLGAQFTQEAQSTPSVGDDVLSGELMTPSLKHVPSAPEVELSRAAVQATRHFVESFEKTQAQRHSPEESIKVSAALLQNLVNLAGETSISRARVEEEMSELSFSIEEMEMTIDRLKGQLRRLEIETEAQIMFRMEQVESEGAEGFDPLEMDRYSHLQQLARSLIESASDIQDVKETFSDTVRDMETLLLQQSRINTELQEGLMRSQMVPFSRMVPRLRRIVRQVASELDKTVELKFDNIEGELDRTVLERMVAPLEHMLRNAVDHGIESPQARLKSGKSKLGTITLSVAREGAEVVIRLSDDGAGINTRAVKEKAIERGLIDRDLEINDHDVIQFILHAGFSTATEVTQISGRGVGMDVVYSEIKQLGGTMEIESTAGKGTTFNVRLPFTVSVNRALMVTIGHDTYAIPLNSIEGIVRVSPYELEAYYQPDAPLFEYAGQSYDLMYMGGLLDMGAKPRLEGQTMPLPVILVRGGDQSVAVQVDRLLGSREIVVKSLGPQFSMVEGLSGATVLGDGSVVVIMDLMAMIRSQSQLQAMTYTELDSGFSEVEEERNLRVMVVDDSVTVRKVTSRFLERHGMEVVLAKDGVDAMQKLQESDVIPDVMLLDIEMPRMDGFEVASRVRHSDRLGEIPIIMITSRTGAKHRDRAVSLGVNHYLGKPYQESLLLEAISTLTGKLVEL